MNRKDQIQQFINENKQEEILQIINEITTEAKDRRKSQIICEEGIHEIIIRNIPYFIEQEKEKEITECLYQLIKRPTLITYFSVELTNIIIENEVYQWNFDILRSITREQQHCKELHQYIPQIINQFKNVDFFTNQYACYSLSNLAKWYSNEFYDLFIHIVDKMCVCNVNEISEEHWLAVGEALCMICQHIDDKIKLAGKIDYKLVELRDNNKEKICLCNIIRDIIQFLAK